MCLILFAHQSHPRHRLVLVANRDEYFSRPTERLQFWPEAPEILAGRDAQGAGTWLGVSRRGRFAAVTNLRVPPYPHPRRRSRGLLAVDFLAGADSAARFAARTAAVAGEYAPFNLLLHDGDELWYVTSAEPQARPVAPGLHALSNGLLDAPWPKAVEGVAGLEKALAGEWEEPRLFSALIREEPYPPETLPATGIDPELERALSPPFITLPKYGTRSSALLILGPDGGGDLVERSYPRPPLHRPRFFTERRFRFASPRG